MLVSVLYIILSEFILQNELSVSLIEESEEDLSLENIETDHHHMNGKKV